MLPQRNKNLLFFLKNGRVVNLNCFFIKPHRNNTECEKILFPFNDFKQCRMALYCSNKTIYIIKRSNIKIK